MIKSIRKLRFCPIMQYDIKVNFFLFICKWSPENTFSVIVP